MNCTLRILLVSIGILWTCSCSEVDPVKTPPDSLTVTVEMPTDSSGTTHHASKIDFSYEGKAPLTITSDDEKGVIAPFPVKKVQIDAGHFYLIGTSSPGGGMDRWHVLSIAIGEKSVELKQELVYTVSRLSPGIVVSKTKVNRVGVVVPSDNPANADEWELSVGGTKLSLSDLRIGQLAQENTNDISVYGSELPPGSVIKVLWLNIEESGTFMKESK